MVKALIFDWGDTVMRDYALKGPMHKWDKVNLIPGVEELLESVQEKYICIIYKECSFLYKVKFFPIFFMKGPVVVIWVCAVNGRGLIPQPSMLGDLRRAYGRDHPLPRMVGGQLLAWR